MFEDYYFDDPELQGLLAAAGPIMDTPRRAAVMPMTTEAAPAVDLAGLSSLYGMNFGSDFGSGGAGGGIYPTNPDLQMLQAPLSSKGNPTAYGGNYISVTSPTQTFRLVDKNTDKVVYEGVGYEGAQEAIDRASALTAEKGAKAQWQIQTPNPQQKSGYSIVANEKRNQSTVGDIASVALPVGMALLTGGMSLPAQMAGAAMGAAAGAGLAGKDPVKAGLISAATAGLGNVTGANEAIGRAVSNVGGALAGKTAEEVAKTAAEKAAEQIVVTGLSKAAQGAGSAIGNTLLSQAAKAGLSDITGYKTPAQRFAEQPLPEAFQPPVDMYAGLDPIDVLARRAGSGAPFAAAFPVPVNAMLSGALNTTQPTQQAETAEEYEELDDRYSDGYVDPETGEIVVSKYRPINPPGGYAPIPILRAVLGTGSILDSLGQLKTLPSDPALMEPETQPDEIVVDGSRIVRPEPEFVVPDIGLGIGSITGSLPLPKPDPALTEKSTLDKIKDAANVIRIGGALLPLIPGGGGGSGIGGIGGAGPGLNFREGSLRPTIRGGGIGGAGGYPYTPETYGRRGGDQETEYLFFTRDPVTDQGSLQPSTGENYKFFNDPPAPILNEAAAPAMLAPSGNAFAEGGEVDDDMVKHLVEYHKNGGHQGPGQVKGIGSGQDDKIPAWLSDGEYVWSAQDVADLGDGSTDEGVRRLDKMRQMVRRQAGRKDVKKIAKPQKGIDRMLKAVGGLA